MPPSAHHFIPVWQSLDAEKTYRSKVYGPSRKRKRQAPQDDSDDDDEGVYSQTSPTSQSASRAVKPVSGANRDRDPYHVAGHAKGLPLPDYPFPHAPVKGPRRAENSETTQKDLAAVKPPLYVPPAPEEEDAKSSLRRHHLSVMTTIMHTSLLRGDYIRAGRAWGMILRTEVLGRAVDVRTHERWGIGAEILLQQHTEHATKSSFLEDDNELNPERDEDINIREEGFQMAKDYYERLILQFPYQKTHPSAVSSLTFYPAMYGLCVYEIQQKYKQALARAERASRSPSPAYDQDRPYGADGRDESGSSQKLIDAITRSTLDEAIALADRMTELMLSPPNDRYPPLLQLRAMLALWIVDLSGEVTCADKSLESLYDLKIDREKGTARKFVAAVQRTGGELPEYFTLDE